MQDNMTAHDLLRELASLAHHCHKQAAKLDSKPKVSVHSWAFWSASESTIMDAYNRIADHLRSI